MTEKPYTEVRYSIYDRSLYLQRLLFAVDSNFRSGNIDKYATDYKDRLMIDAEKSLDNAITALTDVLEIIGYFPTIREIATGERHIWKQPTKYEKKSQS